MVMVQIYFEFMSIEVTGNHSRKVHRPSIENLDQRPRAMLAELKVVARTTHYTISFFNCDPLENQNIIDNIWLFHPVFQIIILDVVKRRIFPFCFFLMRTNTKSYN